MEARVGVVLFAVFFIISSRFSFHFNSTSKASCSIRWIASIQVVSFVLAYICFDTPCAVASIQVCELHLSCYGSTVWQNSSKLGLALGRSSVVGGAFGHCFLPIIFSVGATSDSMDIWLMMSSSYSYVQNLFFFFLGIKRVLAIVLSCRIKLVLIPDHAWWSC